MQKGNGSKTAILAAIQRAAHPLLDSEPWIFRDEFAAPLCGIHDPATVLASLNSLEEELSRNNSPAVVKSWLQASRLNAALRARYAEDELHQALSRGVLQYVILGAGLDSFAYRRRDLEAGLRIFEVDYLATQQAKLARLHQLQIQTPKHLTFVPIDFEEASLLDTLQEMGFRREGPAFFSLLGVAQYLTNEAIERTLMQIASAASGSEIVMNYLVPAGLADDEGKQVLHLLESLTAARGEPVHTYFTPEVLAQRMKVLGFAQVWDLGADEVNARYLTGRTDGLRISSLVHLVKARV